MPVTMTIDKLGNVLAGVRDLAREQTLVGVPAEDAYRKPEEGEKAAPINNAGLLYIHENGAPEVNIPARPTLVPGVKSVEGKIAETYRKAAEKRLDGDLGAMALAHQKVGLTAQAAVRARFGGADLAPLKPATLAARRRAGFKGELPLIVTGQLRNAINYVVRKPGD